MAFTVLNALALAFLEQVRLVGLDPDEIRTAAGLTPADLEDPDERLAGDRYAGLWDAAAVRDRRLATALARQWRPEMLGVIGYVMASSGTVHEAFAAWQRFTRLIGEPLVPQIEVAADRFFFRRALPPRIVANGLFPETAVAGTAVLVEQLTGVLPPIREIRFQHREPPHVGELRASYGCPVMFEQPETTVEFPPDVAHLPVRRPDPGLRRFLERHASALAARLSDETLTAERVRACIIDAFQQGEPSQRVVARELAMSERTLQRRLQEEGTSFATVVDRARRELAEQYLRESPMPVHAIAFLLGYSEPSAFHRAFRRWTGLTPQAFRRVQPLRCP
jgi:AraC-like DNA-binding protein